MKTLLTTLILFVSLICIAQTETSPYTNFKIDNGQFIYEKVFTLDSLNSTQIETLLLQQLPQAKGITNVKSNNGIITCNFVNLFVNYEKYIEYSPSTFGRSPINANVNVFVKNGKYKVIVNSIVFSILTPTLMGSQIINTPSPAEGIFLKNEQTEYRTRSDLQSAGKGIELQFTDIFTLKTTSQTDW